MDGAFDQHIEVPSILCPRRSPPPEVSLIPLPEMLSSARGIISFGVRRMIQERYAAALWRRWIANEIVGVSIDIRLLASRSFLCQRWSPPPEEFPLSEVDE